MAKRTRARATRPTSIILHPEPSAAIQALVRPPKVTVSDVFRETQEVAENHRKAVGMVAAMTDALLLTAHQTNTAAAKHLAAAAG